MKRLMILGPLLVLLIFIGTTLGLAEGDTVVGEILEMDKNKSFIQVRDYTYKVDMVLVDLGDESGPVLGSILDLEDGDLVEVYRGDKDGGFWRAEKVIVFKGPRKKEILKTLK